jgi:hypothetical protein
MSNPTDAWQISKQAERFFYAAKDGFRAIDATVDGDPLEQRVQIAFGIAR